MLAISYKLLLTQYIKRVGAVTAAAWELNNKVFVYVAVPESKKVTIDWALILRQLVTPQNSIIRKWSGLPVNIAREVFAREALAMGAKYLFFLDSDQIIPPNSIIYLMQLRLPIVSGLYYSKRNMYCAWMPNDDGKTFRLANEKDLPPNSTIEVGATGLGCTLIDTRIFKEIPEPRFPWTQMHPERNDIPDEFSEDFNFCRKVHNAGFPIYVATGLRCGHEWEISFDPEGRPDSTITTTLLSGGFI